MGSFENPPTWKPAPPQKPSIRVLLAAAVILILFALKWHDVVEYVSGEPQLKPKYQRQLRKKLEREDMSEQYVLLATSNCWYTCLHGGFTQYYLRVGEVWKYGTTSKGERGRYSFEFLTANRVNYRTQFAGTDFECKLEEQRKLYAYPLLPENLARPEEYRLLRPPYNPILR